MRLLPKLGSPGYYVMLALIASLVLGPLGGITAAYMNYALGFFLGGQVLAGILGSVVTLGYGPEGKHGANYMQTMAASVSSMAAMGVLVQAMVWLGMPLPPAWHLIAYFLCIGMFGVGVGMLYTPILVDKLQLAYPSGLAVANILRALTDKKILRRSVGTLGGGVAGGIGLSLLVEKVKALAVLGFSSATFGGGMIVGARISASAILVGAIGVWLTPWLEAQHYIAAGEPFRKIGFIFALGTILGAAIVDMSLLGKDAVQTIRRARSAPAAAAAPTDGKANIGRLLVWVAFWAAALTIVASELLHISPGWILFAIVMSFVFQLVNGISQGITDQNPISSAFVVTVLIMAGMGLKDPLLGLFAGSVLLVSCSVGVDMQQDRSTGWRLGSDRKIQFRFQMLGVVMGAVLAVLMTRVFLEAFPILKANQHGAWITPYLKSLPFFSDFFSAFPEYMQGGSVWQSAMTYKFVGVLNTLGEDKSRTLAVLFLGIGAGLTIEIIRKLLLRAPRYKAWKEKSAFNRGIDFVLDALLIASPYASSFGGFVDFNASLWFGMGGIVTSVLAWVAATRRHRRPGETHAHAVPGEGGEALPEDMSGSSLVGGGLIAGEALFILYIGIASLVASGALGKIFGQ